MSPERYIILMAKAGIGRGQLATHFEGYDHHTIPPIARAGKVLDKPKLEEDLSHLNSAHWQAKHKAPPPCLALVKWVAQGTWEKAPV